MRKLLVVLGVAATVIWVVVLGLSVSGGSSAPSNARMSESQFISEVSRPAFEVSHSDYVLAVKWCQNQSEYLVDARAFIHAAVSQRTQWGPEQQAIVYQSYYDAIFQVC